ncbi:MAG: mechanosensitive ion channel family protein [Muribaculaceae bacterium]|nr:mechanosensitive ion channel family protein [Muribaculaceae bacterium]
MNFTKHIIILLIIALVSPTIAWAKKTDEVNDSSAITDSITISLLKKELEETNLAQANLRMEMENMRLNLLAADSIKSAKQRIRIDSLRKQTKGIPVVVEGDTLFYLFTKRGGYSTVQRAEITATAIENLGKRLSLNPDSVIVYPSELVTDIMYRNKVLFTLTDQDAMWSGTTRDSLATNIQNIVRDKLTVMQKEHSLWQIVKRAFYLILVIVALIALFKGLNWLFVKLRRYIKSLKDTKLRPIKVQNYELLNTDRQVYLLIFGAKILRLLIMLVLLLLAIPLVFAIFPQTEKLATSIFLYIWTPVKNIIMGIIKYIPNLFTIIVIWLAVKYVVKLFHYLAGEIENKRLSLSGFYPDWAMPTFNIVRFLLYAFMIAMIYPYLPGSDSGIFQGISVFVGLIVSLGSSTVIGNIIAGMVITYMRPFKIGDRIKLNETTGDIIEKTPFVTRIKTPKNEIVTVPNSFIMSSHTVNYSTSAREYGLIIHSEVTIGYDAPWRKVHQLLIDAALMTPGISAEPEPFVLETSLSDWYPVYQVNAFIKDAQQMAKIYSDLHQNIQDCFNKAGVEIMSPHYVATRDGNETTIPRNDGKEQ